MALYTLRHDTEVPALGAMARDVERAIDNRGLWLIATFPR